MGQNSEVNSRFFFFGISVIKVWFKCSGKEVEFKI